MKTIFSKLNLNDTFTCSNVDKYENNFYVKFNEECAHMVGSKISENIINNKARGAGELMQAIAIFFSPNEIVELIVINV